MYFDHVYYKLQLAVQMSLVLYISNLSESLIKVGIILVDL